MIISQSFKTNLYTPTSDGTIYNNTFSKIHNGCPQLFKNTINIIDYSPKTIDKVSTLINDTEFSIEFDQDVKLNDVSTGSSPCGYLSIFGYNPTNTKTGPLKTSGYPGTLWQNYIKLYFPFNDTNFTKTLENNRILKFKYIGTKIPTTYDSAFGGSYWPYLLVIIGSNLAPDVMGDGPDYGILNRTPLQSIWTQVNFSYNYGIPVIPLDPKYTIDWKIFTKILIGKA